MTTYFKVLRQFSDFKGRSNRKDFWTFELTNLAVYLLLVIVDAMLFTTGVFSFIFSLFVLIPDIAVGVRRLHDTGRSGWMYLIIFIPIIGIIWFWIIAAQEGTPYDNDYGSEPTGDSDLTNSWNSSSEENSYETKAGDINELRKAKVLLDEGVITHEDFASIKKKYL